MLQTHTKEYFCAFLQIQNKLGVMIHISLVYYFKIGYGGFIIAFAVK